MRSLIAFVFISLVASVGAQPRTVAIGAEVSSLSGSYADGQAASVRVTLPRRNGWLRVDASAEERETLGFISTMSISPVCGSTENWMLQPPASTPISRMIAIAASRMR